MLNFLIRRPFMRPLLLILFCAALLRVFHLQIPSELYFDEVYHGFTAQQMLYGNPQVYDPWAKPPVGKAFEWTHPPLGKLIIASTLAVFGDNLAALRLSPVIFSLLCIFLTFLLGYKFFQSATIGLLAAFLLTLENSFLTHSRIAMIDMHFIGFTLMTVVLYWFWKYDERLHKNWMFLFVALSAGLALATKWTAVYLLALIGADLLLSQRGKRFLTAALFLAALPPLVYLCSYLHYFSLGYTWEQFVELQKQMWYYHTHLQAKHAFQSVPWQWIFNLRPVWLHVQYYPELVANIYDTGNSVVLVGGLFAILLQLVNVFLSRSRPSWSVIFLIGAYSIFWLPWSFSPRIMFFYHYLPAIPFLCLLLAYTLNQRLAKDHFSTQLPVYLVLGLSMVWFVLFYPHNTSIPMPKWLIENVYFLIPGWR